MLYEAQKKKKNTQEMIETLLVIFICHSKINKKGERESF